VSRTDVHNHVLPRAAIDLFARDPVYRVEISGKSWRGGHHPPFLIEDAFVEPDAKLAQLEQKGIDAAVVSVIPPLFYTDLPLEPLVRLCAAVNEGLAAFQEAYPDRFHWLAQVPIGFPQHAADALSAAVVAGAVGVEIPTRVGPRRLDEPAFEHPGLRIVLVHGGGYFPYQAGRLRHARTVRPELVEAPKDPWAYRGQLVIDTITHDRSALVYAVSRMGLENVVLGTDLPFDMATPEPMAALEEAVGAAAASTIAVDNPRRIFALDPVPA
jgi:aminocarboxymuconate-semialdehyde decarboxylase